MTVIRVDAAALHLEFPGWEAAMTGRGAFTAPREAIACVELLPGWTSEVLGMRSGLVVSGFVKLGTFRHPSGTRRLVAMRRGAPVLRVGLRSGSEFDELLFSDPDAAAIAAALAEGARA